MRVGVIGIGKMGEPIAPNLLKSGHWVVVNIRTSTCTKALRPAGANRDCYETPPALSMLSGKSEKVLDSGTHSRVDTQLTMANTNVRPELITGQVRPRTGVSADAIPHYEKLGLLKKAARSDSGHCL